MRNVNWHKSLRKSHGIYLSGAAITLFLSHGIHTSRLKFLSCLDRAMFPWLEADHGKLSYRRFRQFNMIVISLVVKYRYNLSCLDINIYAMIMTYLFLTVIFSVCLSVPVCLCRFLSFLFYLSHFLLFVVYVSSLSIRLSSTHLIKNYNFESGAGFSLSHTSFVDTSDRLVINALINGACCPSQYNTILMHYNDVIMSAMAPQITGISIVWSTVCSGANLRRHQSSASLGGLPKKGR